MPDIVTSKVFSDGEKGITATKLNQIQSLAVIQPAFYSAKPASPTLDTTDQLLALKNSGAYARVTGSQLIDSVAGQLTLADATQNGMLRKVSGLTTDFVDGTNNCQDLVAAFSGIAAIKSRLQVRDNCSYALATLSATGQATVGPIPWFLTVGGGGTSVNGAPSGGGQDIYNKCYGVFGLQSGLTSASYLSLASNPGSLVAGLGALDIYFRAAFGHLPSSADTLTYYLGLSDSLAGFANAIFLSLVWSGSAPAWVGNCHQSSLPSTTAPATTPAIVAFSSSAFTYYNIRISISAAWDSVTFYVNGVQIGAPITLNIPAAGTLLNPIIYLGKNAGSAVAPILYLDDVFLDYQYALP